MTIIAAPADLAYLPWNGWGREMPAAVPFDNNDTTNEVWYSVQKQPEENAPIPPTAGGVRVI